MSAQDLSFYVGQRYPVVLTPLTEDEGGGWFAEIKELPGCVADGESPQEAMESLETSKRLWITTALKRGDQIPLPDTNEEEEYSGRVTLRMPRTLHRKVSNLARRERMSLNQFLLTSVAFQAGLFEASPKQTTRLTVFLCQDTDSQSRDALEVSPWFSERHWGCPTSVRFSLGDYGGLNADAREQSKFEDWTSAIGDIELKDCFGQGARGIKEKVR